MPSTAQGSGHRQRVEAAALATVLDRLRSQFPEFDEEQIVRVVRGRREGFQDSPVRDFVAILGERSARNELRAEVRRHRA